MVVGPKKLYSLVIRAYSENPIIRVRGIELIKGLQMTMRNLIDKSFYLLSAYYDLHQIILLLLFRRSSQEKLVIADDFPAKSLLWVGQRVDRTESDSIRGPLVAIRNWSPVYYVVHRNTTAWYEQQHNQLHKLLLLLLIIYLIDRNLLFIVSFALFLSVCSFAPSSDWWCLGTCARKKK